MAKPEFDKESALDKILSFSKDLIFIFNKNRIFSYVSSTGAKAFGYEVGELLGKKWTDLKLPPEIIGSFAIRLNAVFDIGKPLTGETIFRAGEEPKTYEYTLSPIKDEKGDIESVISISRDITDRQRTEEELRKSEARYRRIVDTATEGIWVLGPDTMTTFVNTRMARMLGCSEEEMIGRPVTDFMFEEDVSDHLRKMENRRQEISEAYERRFRRKDGLAVRTITSATPVFDDEHKFQGSFAMVTDITERKQAEEALLQSQNRLEAIRRVGVMAGSTLNIDEVLNHILTGTLETVNASVGMIFLKDTETGNFKWGASVGLSKAFVAAHRDQLIKPGEGLTGRSAETDEAIEAEGFNNYIGVPIRAGMEIVGVMNILTRPPDVLSEQESILINAIGAHVGFALRNAQLFTELEKLEEALEDSEEKFRTIFEEGPLGIVLLGKGNRFLSANNMFCQMVDYSQEELERLTFENITLPEDIEMSRKSAEAVFSGKVPLVRLEKRYVRKNGEIFWARLISTAIRDEKSEVKYLISMLEDVTERRRAEERLRENQYFNDSLLRLYRSLGQATTYRDIIEALRPEIRAILGYESAHLYVMRGEQEELLLLDAGGTVEEGLKRLMGMGPEFRTRIGDEDFLVHRIKGDPYLEEMVRWPGVFVVEDVSTHPLSNKDIVAALGNQHTLVGSWLSLAEKRLGLFATGTYGDEGVRVPDERQLDYLRTLSNHVAVAMDRVRFLAERREAEQALAVKAKELARSNKELEEFAYVASHDLQEPLRTVSNYVQLLAKRYQGKLDKDADEFINFAMDGTTRMKNLIGDLLTYSRAVPREKVPTDCSVVFKQVLMDLKPLIEENGAVVTSGDLPIVSGDPTQLRQLLQNLISNAIKFRREEPPKVHVSAERQGNKWLFAVKDNGIGIAPQYFDRIFTVFQRLHAREQYPGTGIGLALCKKIVESQGGRIWVESKPGVGSTFYFTIAYS